MNMNVRFHPEDVRRPAESRLTVQRIGRFLDRAARDIRQGIIAGFDRLWYG